VQLTEAASFMSNLDKIGTLYTSELPKYMEHYGQSFGYIHYSTELKGDYATSKLKIDGVHDKAYVFLDGKKLCAFDRRDLGKKPWQFWKKPLKEHSFMLPKINGGAKIEILVDCMGRVNYGKEIYDRKGITGGVYIDGQEITGWSVYTLPFDNLEKLNFLNSTLHTPQEDGRQRKKSIGHSCFGGEQTGTGDDVPKEPQIYAQNCTSAPSSFVPPTASKLFEATRLPMFFKGKFKTASQADCFVHLDGFTKGCVFVNGFNLGRFWSIGPQKALCLPGALLRDENEIIVFEQEGFKKPVITITDKPNLGKWAF